MGDTGNAMLAAIAITAALYHRERTGQGQAVSTSIINAQLLSTSYAWIRSDGTPGDWRHVDGGQYGLSPYCRLFRCRDNQWIYIAAERPEQQARLLLALAIDVDPADEDATLSVRLEGRMGERPAAEWFAVLDAAGVLVEMVDEEFCRTLFDDPEARSAQLVAETWAGGVGRFEDPGLLVNLSATPGVVQRGPCLCGEHTREILLEHGYSAGQIDDLASARVVLDAPVAKT
jgi:crotonobetainyl-CoA:carnitine CoA-transferase CaiB-like acyl-CoA transferase